jgi:hypothetical protein
MYIELKNLVIFLLCEPFWIETDNKWPFEETVASLKLAMWQPLSTSLKYCDG